VTRFEPATIGWHLGRSHAPNGVDLWVPYDRTTGVYGAQGSGKTLDLLTPALLAAPGAALVTLTKLDDLLLTVDRRAEQGPVAVLDPFGLAPGLPELVWDPIGGCVDSMVAERRAKAFTAGTIRGAVAVGSQDDAARFYAHEASKVLQAFFHAAALTNRSLDHVLEWVADPQHASLPEEILRTHPDAAPFWDGLLRGALHGDGRTAANTAATVQQAMALFFQASMRARCVPGPGRTATDLADLISRNGTVYLLGRDDPYASASPLLTAVAEHVLDTALQLATASPYGRLCPTFLAVLDELPSTAPLPTLRTRMANERALGLSFLYACQTWRQLVICYGEDEAKALFALSNNIIVFGGGKDGQFYRELSELIGTTRIARTTYTRGHGTFGRSTAGEDVPILRPEEIRQLPERQALVVAENARPLIASLRRCIDGKPGKALLAAQKAARNRTSHARAASASIDDRTRRAIDCALHLHLHPGQNTFSANREGRS
jgi:type IV secretion system protein VirD4